MTDSLLVADFFGLSSKELFWAGIFVVAIVWIVAATADSILKTQAKERTKREIAAYVAEGSIAPEDAQKLLYKPGGDDFEKKVADAVAWGTVKPEKAADLLRSVRSELRGEEKTT